MKMVVFETAHVRSRNWSVAHARPLSAAQMARRSVEAAGSVAANEEEREVPETRGETRVIAHWRTRVQARTTVACNGQLVQDAQARAGPER